MSSYPSHPSQQYPLPESHQPSSSFYSAKMPYDIQPGFYDPNQSSGAYHQPPAYGAQAPGFVAYPQDRKFPTEFWYLGTRIPDPSLPRTSLITQKCPGYDPQYDWQKLQSMIEVRRVNRTTYHDADPVRVGGLLLTLSTFQRDALNDFAVVASGEDLCQWMAKHPAARGFRAGKAVEALRGIAMGPVGYDVWLAHSVVNGGLILKGHDAMALVEIVCDRDQNDLWLLMSHYKRVYDVELTEAIKKKFSGKFERLLLSALKLERPADNLPVQADRVAADVHALWDATRSKPLDEPVTEILTKRSKSHLAAVITQYAAQRGTKLRKELKGTFKDSDYGNAILYILDGAKYKEHGQGIQRDAKLIMSTMEGVGTKTLELNYRLVRAQWNKHRFLAVKKAFKEKYSKKLEERIAEDTSSHYQNVLVIICQQTLDLEGKDQ